MADREIGTAKSGEELDSRFQRRMASALRCEIKKRIISTNKKRIDIYSGTSSNMQEDSDKISIESIAKITEILEKCECPFKKIMCNEGMPPEDGYKLILPGSFLNEITVSIPGYVAFSKWIDQPTIIKDYSTASAWIKPIKNR